MRIGLGVVLAVLLAGPAPAAPLARSDVPEPLRPWIDWALHGNEDKRCPFLDSPDSRECAWPSRLTLALDEHGGRFTQHWLVHRASEVPLPGGDAQWPQQVRVGDRPGVVTGRDGTPVVHLEAGTHAVTGAFEWEAMPEWLPTPWKTGIVALTLAGEPVAFPTRDAEGRLWLRARATTDDTEARLDVVVVRLLRDDVPALLTTRLELNVAGKSRETVLARVLPDGFVPLGISSVLPARIEPDGRPRVQLRPGAWTIEVDGRHDGRLTAVAMPPGEGAWVSEEIWAFAAVPALREVTIEGVDAVDPTQTMLPEDWRGHPAYRLTRGETMKLVETRRGDTGAADQLALQRTWWLDFDGGGYTVQDRVTATMTTAWRLEMAPPLALGRAAVNAQELPITRRTSDGPMGVEVRQRNVVLAADARLDGAVRRVPATGWLQDFGSVSGTLNLPPGWRLFHARGVDSAEPTWVTGWSLLDLFVVLVTSMAVFHLYGIGWAAIALATLTLVYPEPAAPRWVWLALLGAEALRRALPPGRVLTLVQGLRLVLLVGLIAIAVPYVLREARQALHPALELPTASMVMPVSQAPASLDEQTRERLGSLGHMADGASGRAAKAPPPVMRMARRYELDPTMRVQTGPGTPTWTWSRVSLGWQGPVERDQTLRFILLPPWANRVLGFLRVALVAVLLLCFVRDVQLPVRAAAVLVLILPVLAHAELPSDSMLTELRNRLLEKPDCAPACVGINRLAIEASGDVLRMRLEVDAAADAGVALPGSAQDWTPTTVVLDGRPAAGLARRTDGQLWLALTPGRHEVLLEGGLPPRDTVSIPLPEGPGRVSATLAGWTLAGVREDGLTDGNLQLTRLEPDARGPRELEPGTLPAFVRVTRRVHLGLTWEVDTTIDRLSPLGAAIVLDVPALDGEAVTTGSVRTSGGKVAVSLAPQASQATWHSVLDQRDAIRFAAPEQVPWLETWSLDVAPMWHVETEGVPLVQPSDREARLREWRPWPGEAVKVTVSRPTAVPGPTLTIDSSRLVVRPGLRATDATLTLSVRSSQGGRHRIGLPPGATLQGVMVGKQPQPIRQDGDGVTLPIVPGTQELELTWRQSPDGIRTRFTTPAVDLGVPSVNATTEIVVPVSRWILAVGGPRLGPAVLFWSTLVVIALAAALLGRTSLAPLTTLAWFLLGLGISQVDVVAAILVVSWFLALGWRRRRLDVGPWAFDARQLVLAVWTLVMLAILFAAIRQGLLGSPDMQIAGNGSDANTLRWYTDRAPASLPSAWVVSVPLMVYRFAMLAWAVWIATALVGRWLPWGWESFGSGGLWQRLRRPAPA